MGRVIIQENNNVGHACSVTGTQTTAWRVTNPFYEASKMFDLSNDEILSLSKEHVFYTWSAQAKVNPIAVERAKGVYFWDVEGKRYLDFNSMTMCVNIGHGDERVIKAMQEQVAE